jgi:hypothetical protein
MDTLCCCFHTKPGNGDVMPVIWSDSDDSTRSDGLFMIRSMFENDVEMPEMGMRNSQIRFSGVSWYD